MNKIVDDAIRSNEVDVWASLTERDNIQTSDTNRVGKVAWIGERFCKTSLNFFDDVNVFNQKGRPKGSIPEEAGRRMWRQW